MHSPPGVRWSWKNFKRFVVFFSSKWVINEPHQIKSNFPESDIFLKSLSDITVWTENTLLQKSNAAGSMSETVKFAFGNLTVRNLRTLPYPQGKSRICCIDLSPLAFLMAFSIQRIAENPTER